MLQLQFLESDKRTLKLDHACCMNLWIKAQGGLDVRDAASNTFLTEVAATLKDLQMLCGNDFEGYLQSSAMPATNLPTNVQVIIATTILLTTFKLQTSAMTTIVATI